MAKKINMEINYQAEPTIQEFHASDAFVRGIRGPIGCIAGDTSIVTSKGLVPMQDINSSMQVLSWSETLGQFLFQPCSGSFPKGEDFLYRVSTQHGEFAAAGHHLVFCGDGKYQRIDSLSPGQPLFQCSKNQINSIFYLYQLLSFLNAPHCFEKSLDYQGHCGDAIHQYGQQLQSPIDIDQFCFPSRVYAQGLLQNYGLSVFLCLDGQEVRKREHNHQDLLSYQICKKGFSFQSGGRNLDVVNQACFGFFLCTVMMRLPLGIFHDLKYQQLTFLLLVLLCSSYNYSSTKRVIKILSIKREIVKRKYYDMSVPGTSNYITEDGTIHHNSGKSVGCCWDIFKRACEQHSYRGIRLSRWAGVRNTYGELKTTTIQTWNDWFGNVTKIVYGHPITGVMKIPHPSGDGTQVVCELVFISMDREKDIRKLKSLELTGIWFNEASEMRYSHISMGTGRVNRFPPKSKGGFNWSGVIMDTNPPEKNSWWYKQAEEEKPKDWEFFEQPSALLNIGTDQEPNFVENPIAENIINHTIGYDYYFKQLAGKPIEWVKVFVLNEYGSSEPGSYVYANYNEKNHTDKEFDPGRPIIWTHDFNFVPLCSAILQEYDDDVYVIDEIVIRGAEAKHAGLEFVERYKDYKHCPVFIYGDADGNNGEKHGFESNYIAIRNILQSHGFKVYMKVPLANGAIKNGQNALRAKILDATGKRSFFVNPTKCPTINKLGTVQLKNGSSFLEERDKNGVQDISTALRYYINARFPVTQKEGFYFKR